MGRLACTRILESFGGQRTRPRLFRDSLEIETNRAHALMFMGQDEEAKALYLAHKGQRMSDKDDRLWEGVIGQDFAKLREAGLTHPMMANIEKELGISR